MTWFARTVALHPPPPLLYQLWFGSTAAPCDAFGGNCACRAKQLASTLGLNIAPWHAVVEPALVGEAVRANPVPTNLRPKRRPSGCSWRNLCLSGKAVRVNLSANLRLKRRSV
ncbi:hypothetical protein FA13DRAFT_1720646 [Coprinellus micaceus]|uniref:Uncharacterized protein n=1 Tax=Coprinellus micaceus TaxID=71717 RepID=A0A4Y7S768_COPMI|nr:hypothetical protein FA13DRAFT_1720646 [Coprinellus micaceus]